MMFNASAGTDGAADAVAAELADEPPAAEVAADAADELVAVPDAPPQALSSRVVVAVSAMAADQVDLVMGISSGRDGAGGGAAVRPRERGRPGSR
ncbi:hypothetical protein GCM10009818_26990 [Nakamurella flavida]